MSEAEKVVARAESAGRDMLSYAALGPVGYRLVGFALHAASAGVVFSILRRTFASMRLAGPSPIAAFFVALLWAVLAHANELDRAIASYAEAIRLRPEFPEAESDLAVALALQPDRREIDDAARETRRMLRNLRPSTPDTDTPADRAP